MRHGSRYTPRAQRTIQAARREAGEMGSAQIEPEHLLLGILGSDRVTLQTFVSTAATDVVEKELREQAGKRSGRIGNDLELPLSPGCKNVLTLAAESARAGSHRQIDTSDLLFGLIRQESALASRILREHRGKE